MKRLLIALDVDGTIVREDGVTVVPRVREAIVGVRDAGHHVVLATGRSPGSTLPVAAALGLVDEFAVCSNGAVTLRLDGRRTAVLSRVRFDPTRLLATLHRRCPAGAVAVELPGGDGYRVTESFPTDHAPGEVLVVPWDELSAHGAGRVIVYGATDAAAIALAVAECGLNGLADTTGPAGVLEIWPRGVSKATALDAVRAALGVDLVDTIAVGDQVNDIEMLRWAGRGVAMGHAPPPVVRAADEVAPSCARDGLADVLEPLALRRWDKPIEVAVAAVPA